MARVLRLRGVAGGLTVGALTAAFELFVLARPGPHGFFVAGVDLLLAAAGFTAGAAALRHYRCEGTRYQRSWQLIGLGCGLFGSGQVAFAIEEALLHRHGSSPGLALSEVLVGLAAPLTLGGIVSLAGESGPRKLVAGLDATIVALCCVLEGWIVFLAPAYRQADSLSLRVTTMFYMGASLAMAAAVLIVATRWRDDLVTLALLGSGFVWLSLASTAYSLKSVEGHYRTGDPLIDVGWFAPFLLIAFAANRPARAASARAQAMPLLPLVVPFTAVLLVLLTNFVLLVQGRRLDVFVQAAGGSMVLLVVLRQVILLRELQALTNRLEERVVERTHELQVMSSRMSSVLHNSSDVIAEIDEGGAFTYVSPAARSVLDYGPDELTGRTLLDLVHPDDRDRVAAVLSSAGTGELSTAMVTARLAKGDEQWCPVEATLSSADSSTLRGLVLNIRDVSERVLLEEEVRHQASYDSLTGLVNRRLFHDRVQQALSRASRTSEPLSLLYVDLDHFKYVNDARGHAGGDAVLKQFADRLRTSLRPADTAARVGGDEFVVMLENTSASQAAEVAHRVVASCAEDFVVDDLPVEVTASVGLTTAEPGTTSASAVIHDADVAMYQAKNAGRGRLEVFNFEMGAQRREHEELQEQLRRSLGGNEFSLVYQPIIDLATERVTGLEALVRWQHMPGHETPPSLFLQLVAKRGLGPALDRWVLARACREVQAWQASTRRFGNLNLHVNVVPSSLHDRTFVAEMSGVLEAAHFSANQLLLEISEAGKTADAETIRVLTALRECGVRVLLDDFGTGAVSPATLRSLPISGVKIDSSVVQGMDAGSGGWLLTRGLVDIARGLGLATVAEGVERPRQEQRVRELGFDFGQGPHFGGPLQSADVEGWLNGRPLKVVRLPDPRPVRGVAP